MVLLGDGAQVEPCFYPFEDSANLNARCTVCAERTIGSVNVLDAPDGTLPGHGSCGILFWSVWRRC
jgi:hypothetical protein